MSILTHGSQLTLAPTIRPIVKAGDQTVRGAVERLAAARFQAVQLDAALPGIRPRDLDQRARRDLLGLLGRRDMQLAGLDLFIPRRHFRSGEHLDRAVNATLAAITLAADLGRVPLSIALPIEDLEDDVKAAMVEAAEGSGVRLAVHAEDHLDAMAAWMDAVDLPALGMALDPAAALAQGKQPHELTHRFSKRLTVARLSDSSGSDEGEGGVRTVVGEGELDLLQYRLAVDLATRRAGPVVLDLRGLPNPMQAAAAATAAWDDAAFSV